ncbi:LysR family transcriptional regulator [Azorhizobium oxalatiphilum]|uniref:LysR family transcriptional regulator n=1 Tax=Azorhizobium oxalatiphilum TaxID=980631 RepID=A0A917BRM4_9HYPH|nr:LysR family transcriptional regulator [Azorhizobium oxalatiphilum]GGF54914.1 LysR family transcriptional regulator [Azorhizobium oxalatiphilum]
MNLAASDWENQRAFLAVLTGGSLSAAARALGVAQPTVRRRLEALEQALGTPLFTRSPAGLMPTDAARALGPHAEAMASAAAAFQRAASGPGKALEGTVRITASEIVGAEVLPAMLADLSARHPALAFEVQLSNRTQDLMRQEADIAVRMVRPAQAALRIKRVGVVRLGLFASADFVTRHGTPRTLGELAAFPIIGPDRLGEELKQIVDALGVDVARALRYRTDSHLAQLSAIRAGAGIGLCQVALAARAPCLVPVLPELFSHGLETFLAMHADLGRVRRVRVTFDHLAQALKAYCAEPGPGAHTHPLL